MELNKTYIKVASGGTNVQKTTSFERKFSKRKAIKPVKMSEISETKYYGNNDLNIDLKSAMLILSPKLTSSNPCSFTSSNEEITCIERRRCCAITNTINNNYKNSEIEIPQQQIQELPTIQELFSNSNSSSDDDGFCSDTQPKCPKNNDNIGFNNDNQIKECRNTNINKHAKQQKGKEIDNNKNSNDLLATFNFNMASTPKSTRKMKKLSSKCASTLNTSSDFEFLASKCTSSCYHQLSSTIKTSASSTCCCCCCCCCCCGSNQQHHSITQNSKQIYLARSNSGYKLVQVIDSNNKASQRISSVKNHKNAYYDLKSKYNKYHNARKSYKLPLSLRPVDVQEFERQTIQPIIPSQVASQISSTTAATTSYDVSCNQVMNCNGYLRKLIEKTKKKAQSMKKKSVDKNELDSVKKHKMSLFPRKVKKSLIKQNEFKIEDNADDENIDNIENRSFVQDTFLTDFNQFGQFRVWYV